MSLLRKTNAFWQCTWLISILFTPLGSSSGSIKPSVLSQDQCKIDLQATCAWATVNHISQPSCHEHINDFSADRPAWPPATGALESSGHAGSTSDIPTAARSVPTILDHQPCLDTLEACPIPSFEDWKDLRRRRALHETVSPTHRRMTSVRYDASYSDTDPGMDSLGDDGEISFNLDTYDAPDLKHNEDIVIAEDISQPTARHGTSGHDTDNNLGDANYISEDGIATENDNEALFYDDGRTQYFRSKDAGKTCKERFSYSSFDAGATVLKTSTGAKNAKAILVENKDTYMLMECADDSKYVIVELSDDILVDTVVLANFEFFSSMVRHFRVSVSDRYPAKFDRWKVLGTFEAKNSRDIQPFLVQNPQIWAKYVRVELLSHFGNEYYCPLSLIRVHGTRMIESWQDAERGEDEDEIVDTRLHMLPQTDTDDNESIRGRTPHDILFDSDETTGISLRESPARLFATVIPIDFCPSDTPPTSAIIVVPQEPDNINNGSPQRPLSPDMTIYEAATIDSARSPAGTAAGGSIYGQEQKSNSESISRSTSGLIEDSEPSSRDASGLFAPPPGLTTPINSKSKSSATPTAATALPIVQESFFKSIAKRLQLLETNITSTTRYMDTQTRHINEELQSLNKRQFALTDSFLRDVNRTLLADVRNLQEQFAQVSHSVATGLDRQREQSEREIVELSRRLNLLADEVIFQKRMAIAQATLLLSCLLLVIFTRGVSSPPGPPVGVSPPPGVHHVPIITKDAPFQPRGGLASVPWAHPPGHAQASAGASGGSNHSENPTDSRPQGGGNSDDLILQRDADPLAPSAPTPQEQMT